MDANYLLPNKYKTVGWILFIGGLFFGIKFLFYGYDHEPLEMHVFSIYDDSFFEKDKRKFFKFIDTGIAHELSMIAIILGGLLIGFSREKIEDEFIYKLRKDSLVWAMIFNYAVLIISILFIFNFTFLHVLVFNMFTPLVFFIIRFNFLKIKTRSHEQ